MLIGFGSFGIIFLQAFAAIAILVYLRRHGGEPAWVMAATWAGMVGLIGATIFVALYFRLLATSDAPLVGLLPFLFPLIVLVCLGIGATFAAMRPKQSPRWNPRDRAETAPAPSRRSAFVEAETAIGGDAGQAGEWTVRYTNPAGRELTSEPKPTLRAAILHARDLEDKRGASILKIFDRAGGDGE